MDSFICWPLLPWDRGSSLGVPEELGKKNQVLVAEDCSLPGESQEGTHRCMM